MKARFQHQDSNLTYAECLALRTNVAMARAEVWASWVDLQQQSPRLCTRSPCTLPQVSTGPSQESLPAARSLLLCFFNVAAWWSSRTAETSHISVPESSSAFCWVYSVNCSRSRNPQPHLSHFVGAQTSCVCACRTLIAELKYWWWKKLPPILYTYIYVCMYVM